MWIKFQPALIHDFGLIFILYTNRISISLYTEKGRDPSFELESPSPKNALCQVWLKLAQWFWRRRWKCEKFTPTTTTTTTTENGQILTRKANLSLRLRLAKNNNNNILLCENLTIHLYIKCVYIITLRKKNKSCLKNANYFHFISV